MPSTNNIIYGPNDRPPTIKLIIFSTQYMFVMCTNIVLVLIIAQHAGLNLSEANNLVRLTMVALAISSILQALGKFKIGSGYLASPVVSAIYLPPALIAVQNGGLPLLGGMILFSGIVEVILSRALLKFRNLFPPAVCGFIVMAVGVQLGLIGIQKVLGLSITKSETYSNIDWLVICLFIVSLFTMLCISLWTKGMTRQMSALIGIIVGIGIAIPMGLTDYSSTFSSADITIFSVPTFFNCHISFSLALIFPFSISALIAALRVIGVVTTCDKMNTHNWKSPDISKIKDGIFADGLGMIVSGFLCIPGISSAPTLVGLSKLSGVTSRYIAFTVAAFLIILSFFPYFALVLTTIPISVVGASLTFLSAFMIVGGLQIISSRNIDTGATYILGISLLIGLSFETVPNFYNTLPLFIQQDILSSMLTLSLIVSILISILCKIKIRSKTTINIVNENINPKQVYQKIYNFMIDKTFSTTTLKRIQDSISQIIGIIDKNLGHSNIKVILVDMDEEKALKAIIQYHGDSIHLPLVGRKITSLLEEEGFSFGLADFWNNIFPDKMYQKTVMKRNIQLNEITLYFGEA